MAVVGKKPKEKFRLNLEKPTKQPIKIAMKHIWNSLNYLAIIVAFAMCAVSCADLKNQENLASAAGFKIITPKTPDQEALLKKLPADQVTRINYKGNTYFVLPDTKNNVAYVGNEAQYQEYQRLRLQQQMSNDNLEAAQMNETAAEDWGAWGGWGGWYR
jgi:hypothetical protein